MSYLPGGEPFRFAGDERVALLLHGFSGSPHAMRALGSVLHREGFTVVAPALPGHGTQASALASITADDYIAAAESWYDELQGPHKRIFVVGLSMGGSLGLHIAANRTVEALVTIATPVFMPKYFENAIPNVSRWLPGMPALTNAAALHGSVVGYPTAPLSAVNVFLEVVERAKSQLDRVRSPLLIVHSAHDPTVPSANARYIYDRVASQKRELEVVDHSYHALTHEPHLARIQDRIVSFLREVDSGAP